MSHTIDTVGLKILHYIYIIADYFSDPSKAVGSVCVCAACANNRA